MSIIQGTIIAIKSALATALSTISTIQSSLSSGQSRMSTTFTTTTTIEALPPELLALVLSHLPSTSSSPFSSCHSSLCSALLVCRLWRALGEAPALWATARITLTSTAQLEDYCRGGLPARLALAATLEVRAGAQLTPELGLALREALERRESRVVNLSLHPLTMVPHSLLVQRLSDFLGRQPPGEPKRWPADGTLDLFPVLVPRLEVLRARSEVHEKLLSGAFLAEVAHKLTSGVLGVRVVDVRGMEAVVAMLGDRWLAEMKSGGATVLYCHKTHKQEVDKLPTY